METPQYPEKPKIGAQNGLLPEARPRFFRVSSVGSITQKDWSKLHNDLKIGEFNMLQ